ncbi:MAG: aldose 1-epimerase [Anaerolineae bacterium]|jgi:aldose 1-epimerase|nr:aldose 1-epimerase [Anaerolineae bacterium]
MQIQSLNNPFWQIGVAPSTGGALIYGRIAHQGHWLDFLRPTAPADYASVSKCASFPLIPWSNRLKNAQFIFEGVVYSLRPTNPDGTAVHGVGRYHPWTIADVDERSITLHFDSRQVSDPNFPFQFTAKQIYHLDGPRFTITLQLTNVDSHRMPAGFGHHPYFQRTIGDLGPVAIQLPYHAYFPLEQGIPIGASLPVDPTRDYRQLRPLTVDPLDECLTQREDQAAIWFQYGDRRIQMQADPVYQHLLLFTPADKGFFAIEPVSNANNGFNLLAQGAPHHGVVILNPDESLSGAITLEQIV